MSTPPFEQTYFTLDASSAAKQMAALNATSQHRRASLSGGTSDSLFAQRQPADAPAAAARPTAHLKARRDEFLKFVAGIMNARQTPLPATITGIPSAYDPATSPWKSIEPTAELGGFRLASRDIDLFKLWQLVLSHGGHAKLTRENGWGTLLAPFGLPDELPEPQANGNTSVAQVLSQYYMALLAAFEEAYLRNMQQQKAMHARQQQQQQTTPSNSTVDANGPHLLSRVQSVPSVPTSKHEPSPVPMAPLNIPPAAPPATPATEAPKAPVDGDSRNGHAGDSSEIDLKKRKFQEGDPAKRVRQRTDTPVAASSSASPQTISNDAIANARNSSPSRPTTANAAPPRQSRTRRKIEYVPLARELDTYGGRDLAAVDIEMAKLAARRPQRSVDDWGTVDIDGLTMSIRSRLPTEMSYAITVLSVLSTMRGQSADTGFSLQQCDDLLDELLDLLREQAFGDAKEDCTEPETFWEHRELVSFVRDNEMQIFSDQPRVKSHPSLGRGPKPSPANIIFAVLNLFRNFSLTGENQRFMGQHPDVLGVLLRVCSLSFPPSGTTSDHPPSPASAALALPELVRARRDVLTVVSNLAPFINLAAHPPHVRARLFELLASFLVEPHDLSSPTGIVIQSGAISATSVRPPLIVDLALEAFSKLAQPDANRLTLSRGIKLPWLWSLFSSLVHRLPVSSEDFAITMRMHDVWLSYIEKVVLSIFSICFLASPELKTKIKTDRTLGFSKLILRMVKRFVNINHADARQYFLVSSRRAVEALKLIDEGNDAFESPQTSGPMFAFGMGFGESDVKQMETGVGLLAAFQEDVTWNIMLMPHLDDIMFTELDSLSRISL